MYMETEIIEKKDNQNVLEQQENLSKIADEIIRVVEIRDHLPRLFHETFDEHMARLSQKETRKYKLARKKLSNQELANRTGYTERYIRELRKVKKTVSPECVYALCIGMHLHPLFSDDLVKKALKGYSEDLEGEFAQYLLHNHFHESLLLINQKLEKQNLPLWGQPDKILY